VSWAKSCTDERNPDTDQQGSPNDVPTPAPPTTAAGRALASKKRPKQDAGGKLGKKRVQDGTLPILQ
jgi:hypothetical protein